MRKDFFSIVQSELKIRSNSSLATWRVDYDLMYTIAMRVLTPKHADALRDRSRPMLHFRLRCRRPLDALALQEEGPIYQSIDKAYSLMHDLHMKLQCERSGHELGKIGVGSKGSTGLPKENQTRGESNVNRFKPGVHEIRQQQSAELGDKSVAAPSLFRSQDELESRLRELPAGTYNLYLELPREKGERESELWGEAAVDRDGNVEIRYF